MQNTHIFEKTILKQYDVRGIVDKQLTETDAYFMGKSYGTLLKRMNKLNCVVGFDGRHTSKSFSEKIMLGLLECGIDVTNIGLAPTPTVYFSIWHYGFQAGLVVSASHSPKEYNGFKMLTDENAIWGDAIQELGRIAESGNFAQGRGKLEKKDVRRDYINYIVGGLNKNNKKTLNIVWDAGNGATAAVLGDIAAKIPGKHKTICDVVDGDFPIHHPDPSVEKYMTLIKEEVVKGGFDLGFSFDGDGDRIGVVDSEGYLFFGDQIQIIYARDFLKNNPGEKVMNEVSASSILYDDIRKHGGIPVIWKPGHSIQKEKMKSDGIKMAGETSGHMYFAENHNYDDCFFAAIKMINILANSDETLAEMRHKFPRVYSTKKYYAEVANDDDKFRIPDEIADRIRKRGRVVIDVEGARVEKGNGWWLIRNSNTGPQMTIRCEALSLEGLEECKREAAEQLKLSGYDFKFED
ncbi:MAG: phosphomannomutase/phosphoglucomutase [Rickettsiales bacterium]|jgi:phosphomannomutase|nr:phosphomannomutase/phosphoglucomutase [Rickettsiales bacterium]